MLDKRTKRLLVVINELCKVGSFNTFEFEDLLSEFPERFGMDKDSLMQCLHYLSRESYIEIRYQDSTSLCVSPLPKGRREYETHLEEKNKNNFYIKYVVIAVTILFVLEIVASFLGCLFFGLLR